MQEGLITVNRLSNRFDYAAVAGVRLSDNKQRTHIIVKIGLQNLSIAKVQYETYQSDLDMS